jgi:uncharacterized membrane protein YheB (UPF0754 family)
MSENAENKSTLVRLAHLAQSKVKGDVVPIIKDPAGQVNSDTKEDKPSRMIVLKIIPWILLIGFVTSFLYDFQGQSIQILSYNFSVEGLLKILSISGLIGFLTNWVAIIMLFRPQEKRPLLGQGLVPAQKKVIAEKLSNAVNKNLINPEQIKQKLSQSGILTSVLKDVESGIKNLSNDEEFKDELFLIISDSTREYLKDPVVRENITTVLMEHLEGSFTEKSIEKYIFKLYRNLRRDQLIKTIDNAIMTIPETIYTHRYSFSSSIHAIPDEISSHSEKIEEFLISGIDEILHRIDLRSLIEDNLNRFDEGRLEELIKSSTIDQLNYIKYLGAILGVLGGLVIWNPVVSLILLGTLFGAYFALDSLLYRLKKSS